MENEPRRCSGTNVALATKFLMQVVLIWPGVPGIAGAEKKGERKFDPIEVSICGAYPHCGHERFQPEQETRVKWTAFCESAHTDGVSKNPRALQSVYIDTSGQRIDSGEQG